MDNEVGNAVRQAEGKMKDTVIKAIRDFTDETGLFVMGLDWQTQMMTDEQGCVECIEYYRMKAHITA